MLDRMFFYLQNNMPKVVNTLTPVFAVVTFIDTVDLFLRAISGVVTVIMFLFAVRNHYRKKKLLEIEKQIKDQELYNIMEENRIKYGKK